MKEALADFISVALFILIVYFIRFFDGVVFVVDICEWVGKQMRI